MISDVAICNMALQSIGTRSQISSLTEQSNEAENCNLIFDQTRDEVMGMAFWNFARRTAYLDLLKSAPGTPTNPNANSSVWTPEWPAPPWLYEYAYPTNCLQVRYVTPQINTGFGPGVPLMSNTGLVPYVDLGYVRFIVATDLINNNFRNVVLTNQYQAIGCFTYRVTDPTVWSPNFVNALKEALAAKLAMALSGNLQLANMKYAMANDLIVQARATDGNEGITIQNSPTDWITVRDVGGQGYPFGAGYFMAPYNALYPMIS